MSTQLSPSNLLIRIIERLCKPYYADSIIGDLLELYERDLDLGPRVANRRFVWNTIRFMRFRYIKSLEEVAPKTPLGMYKNYFKVSLRNIRKQKAFSLLNISGLAVGIAGTLLILVYLLNDLSYDKHYAKAEQIYYVANGTEGRYTPAPLLSTMLNELPEVTSGTRIWAYTDMVGIVGNEAYSLPTGVCGDSTFFDIFPQQFVMGVPEEALLRPDAIVLTESLSKRLFGIENPINKKIEIEGELGVVTAIVKDPPINTTIPFEFITTFPHQPYITQGNWTGNNFFTYIKVQKGTDPKKINSAMREMMIQNGADELLRYGYDIKQYLEAKPIPFSLVPFLSIHLHYPWMSQGEAGSIEQFWILALIGFLLLAVAIINYINMTTAKASLRLREIGMRKVFGSLRGQIIRQFFIESYLMTIFSTMVGLLLVFISLPYFNQLVSRNISVEQLINPVSILSIIGVVLLTGLFSGAYPALFLSRFKPVLALKGEFSGTKVTTRKALVVFQFAVSILLISFALIVHQQVKLMQNFEPGWDREQTFAVRNLDAVATDYEVIRDRLGTIAAINSVSLTNMMPSQKSISNYSYSTLGDNSDGFSPDHIFADAGYLDVLDLELISGRFFDESRMSDSMSIVVNEKLVDDLGWEDPIGRKLTRGAGWDFTVIGVVQDFYPTSVKRKIQPLIIRYADDINEQLSTSSILLVSMNSNYEETVHQIGAVFEEFSDGYPFDGIFLSDSFNHLYENDAQFAGMYTIFSALALFVAGLGLIGLATYTLERRSKEAAIRKVLGANNSNLVASFIKDFIVLVALGGIFAVPIWVYCTEQWLSNFANAVRVDWYYYVVPTALVASITILLVIAQTIKTATANPTRYLKQD